MALIAVPVAGSSTADLARRTNAARAAGADLVELRLDTCATLGLDPLAAVGAICDLSLPVIATLRHRDEGGAWAGTPEERRAVYTRADAAGAAYVDVELRHAAALAFRGARARRIVSAHDFSGPGGDLEATVRAMFAAGAEVAKVAVTARDAADLARIERLCRWERRPLIALAMGEHGLPSRLLAGCWGSAVTFARLADDAGSAPGQPVVDELVGRYRLGRQRANTAVYGVIGSPIAHSLSPHIHNAALAELGLDAVYVPFRVEDAPAFWDACGGWIAGLSITIPHKEALAGRCDAVEAPAARIGAINTLYRQDGRLIGANTDVDAIRELLQLADGSLTGARCLVLGAGGVARALVCAAAELGARVTIANRTLARAEALAASSGAGAVPWEQAVAEPYDVLLNGTAVGMKAPEESPWPAAAHRPGTLVFDTVYTPLETRLLRDAEAAGARTICGLEMFLRQAAGQFQRWTGRVAPLDTMRRAALERLSP
jgi:3-dehydroquinate dehydratase/shikimate dehydrogenase